MRKLSLQMQASVDRYVECAGEGPDWPVWNWGPECPRDEPLKARFNAVFRDIDMNLLSRKILASGHIDHWSQFVLDLSSCNAYTAVTPGKGGFMRQPWEFICP